MIWTDERIANLKDLWARGLSASQIAARMPGFTRNAVIGKVHRIGLAGRASPRLSRAHKPKPRRTIASRKEVSVAPVIKTPEPVVEELPPEPEPVIPPGQRHTILTITDRTCKWPIGDPLDADFHFCSKAKPLEAGPYCPYHTKIAYEPIVRQKGRRPFTVEPPGRKFRERETAQ